MQEVTRVDVQVLGPRNYPTDLVKLPANLVEALPDFLARAQKIRPDATYQDVIFSIWELGMRRLNANLVRGILKEIPPPTAAKVVPDDLVS